MEIKKQFKRFGKWIVEIIAIAIAERFFNPVIDLLSGQSLSQVSVYQGIIGLAAIIVSSVLGFILIQHSYKWYKRASMALSNIGLSMKQAGIPERKELEEQRASLSVFTRTEIEPYFEEFLQEARHEIVIVAVSGHIAIRGKDDIFQRLIEQKRLNLQFLILNPKSKLVERLESELDWEGMRNDITTSISSLKTLQDRLSADLKGKLQIVLYDRIPNIGIVILDPESEKPTIQVVNYVSGTDIGSRLAIQIRGMDRADPIPEKYLREYQRFLKSSEEKEFNPLAGKFG